MRKALLLTLLTAATAAGLPIAPAQAQRGEKVLTIFGSDACPTSNGEEIVVCRRMPENERFRIPKDLRGNVGAAAAERWGDRAQSLEYVGRSGTNTCTPVGAGGWTGCQAQLLRKAREDRKQVASEQPALP